MACGFSSQQFNLLDQTTSLDATSGYLFTPSADGTYTIGVTADVFGYDPAHGFSNLQSVQLGWQSAQGPWVASLFQNMSSGPGYPDVAPAITSPYVIRAIAGQPIYLQTVWAPYTATPTTPPPSYNLYVTVIGG